MPYMLKMDGRSFHDRKHGIKSAKWTKKQERDYFAQLSDDDEANAEAEKWFDRNGWKRILTEKTTKRAGSWHYESVEEAPSQDDVPKELRDHNSKGLKEEPVRGKRKAAIEASEIIAFGRSSKKAKTEG